LPTHKAPPSPGADKLLSVVVIAQDEADRIGALLRSVSIADEIIVVDSGSSDATVSICEAWGAKVIYQQWLGYVDQKQFAMRSAAGRWALNLDADEALSTEAAAEILDAVRNAPSDVDGFSMPRLSRYLRRWIRHGGWYPDRKVRLVRTDRGEWVGDGLHEKLVVPGRVLALNHPILHFVYRDIADQVKTMNRFSDVVAQSGKTPAGTGHLLWGLMHAFGKFLECAVWKLGLLDGLAGLVIAVNSAFYVFLKHAKAWEKSLPPDSSDSLY
jgi:glycosyltransferase involved in cell wall biosynthesis